MFLLSQIPLTLTSTHPTSSAPALCTVLFWTSFTQAPFSSSSTHMYSVLLAPPLHLLPVLTIVPSVVCTIAHMKGLRVQSWCHGNPALNPSVPPTAHLCLAVSCTASVCAQYVLSMCSTTVRLLVSRRGLFPHPHRCNVTFSALPHLHVEPHFSSSFSRCGSSAPSPCGCCSSAP